jgi:hypothetical protein
MKLFDQHRIASYNSKAFTEYRYRYGIYYIDTSTGTDLELQ